jgi:hypothetical protein
MKKIMLIVVLFGLLHPTTIFAQLQKVNESCETTPCETGLFCVDTKKDGKKCATCDQSKLNDLSEEVGKYCKVFGEGWTEKSNPDYQNVVAADDRVMVDIYDQMIEGAKKCKEARVTRENTCWNGGDPTHAGQITDISNSIENLSDRKKRAIDNRRVYYCSKSTYDSRLSTFQSKARDVNLPDIEQKIAIAENDVLAGKKIDCSDIERKGNDCERCADAAKDLFSDGFSGSSDKFPDEYNNIYQKALELQKRAKGVVDLAKEKELCN